MHGGLEVGNGNVAVNPRNHHPLPHAGRVLADRSGDAGVVGAAAGQQRAAELGPHKAGVDLREQVARDVVLRVVPFVDERELARIGERLIEPRAELGRVLDQGGQPVNRRHARQASVVFGHRVVVERQVGGERGIEIGEGRFHAPLTEEDARFLHGRIEDRRNLFGVRDQRVSRQHELVARADDLVVHQRDVHRLAERHVPQLVFAGMPQQRRLERGDGTRIVGTGSCSGIQSWSTAPCSTPGPHGRSTSAAWARRSIPLRRQSKSPPSEAVLCEETTSLRVSCTLAGGRNASAEAEIRLEVEA